jgi:hypothetical protein
MKLPHTRIPAASEELQRVTIESKATTLTAGKFLKKLENLICDDRATNRSLLKSIARDNGEIRFVHLNPVEEGRTLETQLEARTRTVLTRTINMESEDLARQRQVGKFMSLQQPS